MFVVGLTGGIGAGKSAVSERFARLGVPVVDTDVIARELTAPGGEALPSIREAFGGSVFTQAGELDRAALRRQVFADPAARARLETILHPRIRHIAGQRLAALDAPYALLVVPLLLETGAYADLVQRTLLVDCPETMRVERVMARSALTRSDIEAIVAAQWRDDERRAAVDDRLDNAGGMEALDAAVTALHTRYLELARAAAGL
ncbi:MAG: dephospho-CoA kinase [Thiobacillus sp.]|nr:dephospho-CoA kinase [Thiobacillus sp.]